MPYVPILADSSPVVNIYIEFVSPSGNSARPRKASSNASSSAVSLSRERPSKDLHLAEEKYRSQGKAFVVKKRRSLDQGVKRHSMFDEELDKYNTYEEYLDSLVSEEDHKYLQDEEMARAIAELGYRSSGDTLSRENFYKLKTKLAEARLLTMQRRPSENPGLAQHETEANKINIEASEDLSSSKSTISRPLLKSGACNGVIKALRSRIQAIRSGELLSILFIRTRIPRKPRSIYLGTIGAAARAELWGSKRNAEGEAADMQISGHIDLEMRMKTENIMPYLNGERRLVPRKTDLTFYNWERGTAAYNSTSNFEVIAELPKLLLRHTGSQACLDIATCTAHPSLSMDSKTTKGSGWQHIKASDDETYAMIFDVYVLYDEDSL